MDKILLDDARQTAFLINTRLQVIIPSILAEGETFNPRFSVIGSDALPVDSFPCTMDFKDSRGIEGLPKTFALPKGESTGVIEGLRATGPDVAFLNVRVFKHNEPLASIPSNPAWVFKTPPYRLYFGDLHIHTRLSNCHGWRCLDPEWCYTYARDISLLDFAAPADHLRGIASATDRWPTLQERARQFNQNGHFATLLAFESSHALGFGGDNNVYWLDDDAPYFWPLRTDMTGATPKIPLAELWQWLDMQQRPYFTVPHHTGRAHKYRTWDDPCYDPDREPLFEIYSSWGSSEMRHTRFPISGGNNNAATYFTDAIKAGARFGLIASSDDHATLPGSVHHFRTEPFRSPNLCGHAHKGLAAVRADKLERTHLFNAMRHKQTYATTDARTLLDFKIGEAGMGQAIQADHHLRKNRQIRLRLTLHDAHNAQITLMRNGEPFATKTIGGLPATTEANEIIFEDPQPADDIAIRDARYHPDPFIAYYARIEDNNGAHQWTSPIWIDLA